MCCVWFKVKCQKAVVVSGVACVRLPLWYRTHEFGDEAGLFGERPLASTTTQSSFQRTNIGAML